MLLLVFSGNGTQIINLETGEEIYQNLLSLSDFDICYNLAKQHHLHVHVYTDSAIISEGLLYMDLRNYMSNKNSTHLSFMITKDISKYIHENNFPIYKFVISSQNNLSEIQKELTSKLDVSINFVSKKGPYMDQVIQKEYEYLDIVPKNTGKAYALHVLSDFLDVDSSSVMAIGDNLNDIDMLKNSGIGVALSDSYEEVKKAASYTTTHTCPDSGFAEAIYHFL